MSVVIRRVKTALQQEYRKAGGIRIQDALVQAHANLGELKDDCLARIDLSLGLISEMTQSSSRQPSSAELRKLHLEVNEMLACCAAVELPGFEEALYAVGRLFGVLISTDARVDGALTPAVNLLRLVRRGSVSPEDLKTLVIGIDQCALRIRGQSQCVSTG